MESAPQDWIKNHIVQTDMDRTVLTKAYDLRAASAFPLDVGDRVLSNEFTKQWHQRDPEVARNRADLQQQIAAGTEARDMSVVPVRAGNAVGLLSSIEPTGAILRRIIEEAEAILTKRPSEFLSR